MTSLPVARWAEPHFVYRMWSYDNVSLYVGMTNNLEMRLSNHRLHAAFSAELDRVDVSRHGHRAEAARVEMEEIHRLRPRYNIMGRGPRVGWTACDYFEAIEHHSRGGGESSFTLPQLVKEFRLRYPNVAEQTLPALGIQARAAS